MKFTLPVVTTTSYLAQEKKILPTEEKTKQVMETAGLLLFEKVLDYLSSYAVAPEIVLLIGKGHNAADTYVLGRHLIQAGVKVYALEFYSHSDKPLFLLQKEQFYQCRGQKITYEELKQKKEVVLIDGIVGSGYHKDLDAHLKEIIEKINALNFDVLAVDCPSGLSGDVGVLNLAIKSKITFYFEYPRIGFFLDKAPNYTGKLVRIDLELIPKEAFKEEILGYLLQDHELQLPKIERKRHKYQSGSVVGFCGSLGMSGAMNLTGLACLKVGAGIVKFLHYQNLPLIFPELILFPLRKWKGLLKKGDVFMAGPGIGKSWIAKAILRFLISHVSGDLVLDADAISLISKKTIKNFSKNAVLTPHRKECLDLLKLQKTEDSELFLKIREYVQDVNQTVIFKGVPTIIFHPNHPMIVIDGGDPGMATAGSGDVLTGMIAGLLAQKMALIDAVALAVFLHQKAGEKAAEFNSSYAVIATDLIENIPDAFFSLTQDLNETHDF
jgi:hydroxyethylthiazole kinase-like uncharacterized protein yjeF